MSQRFRKNLLFILLIISCALAALTIGVHLPKSRINHPDPDELLYVYYAGVFKTVFIKQNHNIELAQSNVKYAAVPFGFYVIGSLVYFSPLQSFLVEPLKIWIFSNNNGIPDLTTDRDIKAHPLPYAQEMISFLRERLLIFRAIVCCCFFVIAFLCGGYLCAIPAVILLLRDPWFIELTSLVLMESIWLAQHLLNILLIFLYLKTWQSQIHKKTLLITLTSLIGITAGLLTATKIHGAVNLAVFVICFVLILWKQSAHKEISREHRKQGLWHIVIAATLCIFCFIAINPALYENPFYGILQMGKFRFLCFSLQTQFQPSLVLPGPIERFMFILETANLDFLDWKTIILLSGFCLILFNILKGYTKGILLSFAIILTLAIFWNWKTVFVMSGLFFTGLDIGRRFRNKTALGMSFIITVVFLLHLTLILGWMMVSYQRYILVLLPYTYFFTFYGIYKFLALIKKTLSTEKYKPHQNQHIPLK